MKKIIATSMFFCTVMLLAATSSNAQYLGTFCFKLDFYQDTWKWSVDQVGDAYQVTGVEMTYPDAMNGGGGVIGNHLLLVVNEGDASSGLGYSAEHKIDLDLATLTGTTDFSWVDNSGNLYVTYTDEPFSNVPCSGLAPVQNQVPSREK